MYGQHVKCHLQSFRESGVESMDWLLAGARLCGQELWTLPPPKLVPSCRRLMWRITAVALKACCKDRQETHKMGNLRLNPGDVTNMFSLLLCIGSICKHSPSICFWQSFSASAGWLIHGCSCGERCLQQSWKLKSHPFRLCKSQFMHTNTSAPAYSTFVGVYTVDLFSFCSRIH